ncbi:MAG TPA: hypothetical protein EYQ50_04370 [Verrucomicrobiales bacterium]|nr:hypothetical protein [Verrucomicrobiales bacterium]
MSRMAPTTIHRLIRGNGMMSYKIKTVFGLLFCLLAVSGSGQIVTSLSTNGFFEPFGIVIDESNNYFITDSANNRVVRFVPDTAELVQVAGSLGESGHQNGSGVTARFSNPQGIVRVNRAGQPVLIIADSGNHVLRQITEAGLVSDLAGTPGEPGNDDGFGPFAKFRFPSGLVADADGNVFIADSKNNSIRMLDSGNQVSTIINQGLFEPAGISWSPENILYIADTRNHSIRRWDLNLTDPVLELYVGSGSRFTSGSEDSLFAAGALFNLPRSLLWMGGETGLVVSDTGNHTIRRVFLNEEVNALSVTTLAGIANQPGLLDGPLAAAQFNLPIGMGVDNEAGIVVIDSANNALRRIQARAPLPPVSNPQIGWVDFQPDEFGRLVSVLIPITHAIFNNEVTIAILSETGTETFFTFGETSSNVLEDDIPIPGPSAESRNTPPSYEDGLSEEDVPTSLISPQSDVTFKVISTLSGRRPSEVIQARFQFKVGNPIITGDNARSFQVENQTTEALMYYTLDGTDPTRVLADNPATIGPIGSGTTIQLRIDDEPVTFRIRGFKTNATGLEDIFEPSDFIQKTFDPDDVLPNRISFGFEDGEASSDFVGSPGQRFFAPVTLSLIPNQNIFSLQFNITVDAVQGPNVAAGELGFESKLLGLIPGFTPNRFFTISNMMFAGQIIETVGEGDTAFTITNDFFTNLLLTNSSVNLLAIGWLERFGQANLFDTTQHDLVAFSRAHNTTFESKNGRAILGGYSFVIPDDATNGSVYEIKIDRPSGTSDGISADVFIEAPVKGSLSNGPANSIKHVRVEPRKYLVGDVEPFGWFNAGDFGDDRLLNNDVVQVFQSAAYQINTPPEGSDFFDAMDSSNGRDNPILLASDGDDLVINSVILGDGELNVDDIYVTFRRSLDPTLLWFERFWEDGELQAEEVENVFGEVLNQPASRTSIEQKALPEPDSEIAATARRTVVLFSADDVQGTAGAEVRIPVRVRVVGDFPLRVLMFNLQVEPLDGAPRLETPVRFIPAQELGAPLISRSEAPGNFSAAWLNSSVEGISGNGMIGELVVVIPDNVNEESAYCIHFLDFSGSPNGLGLFPQRIKDGVISFRNRDASSFGDGIPDAWRLRYFGSARNLLSQSFADADGDGFNNYSEFKAGTDPMDFDSKLNLSINRSALARSASKRFPVRWNSEQGRQYILETADSLFADQWKVVAAFIEGNGLVIEHEVSLQTGKRNFYRVRILE